MSKTRLNSAYQASQMSRMEHGAPRRGCPDRARTDQRSPTPPRRLWRGRSAKCHSGAIMLHMALL